MWKEQRLELSRKRSTFAEVLGRSTHSFTAGVGCPVCGTVVVSVCRASFSVWSHRRPTHTPSPSPLQPTLFLGLPTQLLNVNGSLSFGFVFSVL